MTWYNDEGYEALDELPDVEFVDRFYLKDGEEALLIMLDGSPKDKERFDRKYGAPFIIYERQVPTLRDGDQFPNWKNWSTAIKQAGEGGPRDYVKELLPNVRDSFVGYYTVLVIHRDVDLDDYLNNPRALPQHCRKMLLPAKRSLLADLRRRSKKSGDDLRGLVASAYRSSKDAVSTGDDWSFQDRIPEDLLKILLPDGNDVPHDYIEVLKPLTEEQAKELAKYYVDPDEARGERRGGRGGRDGGERGGGRRGGRDRGGDRGGRSRSRRRRDDDYDDRGGRGRGRSRRGGDSGRSRRRGRDDDYDDPRDSDGLRDDIYDDVPF